MSGSHFWLESIAVERLRFAASLTLDQGGADRIDIGLACLVAADQVADIFALIGELSGGDLRLDPFVLLLGDGDRLARRAYKNRLQGVVQKIILSVHVSILSNFAKASAPSAAFFALGTRAAGVS